MCNAFAAMAVGQQGMQTVGSIQQAHMQNKRAVAAAERNNRATLFNMNQNQVSRIESRQASAKRQDAIYREGRKRQASALVSGVESGVSPDDVVDALVFDASEALTNERISQSNQEAGFDRELYNIGLQANNARSQLFTQDLYSLALGGLLGIGGAAAQGQVQNMQYQALSNPNG